MPELQNEPASPAKRSTSKNLVICCDGTGNQFGSEPTKHSSTGRRFENNNSNVVRLYTCLHEGRRQRIYYHPGVGTMGAPSSRNALDRWWTKVEGLGFGLGFTENIADAYRFLMQNYVDGDRIYMFGFSRGAYSVRALAGALSMYGLLCPGNEGHLTYLLSMYAAASKRSAKKEKQGHPRRLEPVDDAEAFRRTFSRDVSVHFMGVWDTVSSVGWIWDPVKLLYDGQNPILRQARHAISIDERRCFFQAMPWDRPMRLESTEEAQSFEGTPQAKARHLQDQQKLRFTLQDDPNWKMQDVVQAWFPGVHSDIGGSYCLEESGPALEAFKWMYDELETTKPFDHDGPLLDGLQVVDEKKNAIFGDPSTEAVLARWHGPKPDRNSKFHQSLRRAWRVLEAFPHKYYDYNGDQRTQFEPWPHNREIPEKSLMHPEVRRRLKLSETTSDPQHKWVPRNLEAEQLATLTAENCPDLHPESREKLLAITDETLKYSVYHKGLEPSATPRKDLPKVIAAACVLVGFAAFFVRRT